MVTPRQRRAFLDERQAIAKERYDGLHSPTYDEHWSEISPTHRAFMQRLLALTAPDALVVDVACGTGKYWEMALATSRRVLGADQSEGMLAIARWKYPQVKTECSTCSTSSTSSASMASPTRCCALTRWKTWGPRTGRSWSTGS